VLDRSFKMTPEKETITPSKRIATREEAKLAVDALVKDLERVMCIHAKPWDALQSYLIVVRAVNLLFAGVFCVSWTKAQKALDKDEAALKEAGE
jgi:hypothetical protein